MAQWSEKEIEKRKTERIAAALAERSAIFQKFREGGWEVAVLDPLQTKEDVVLKNDYPKIDPHYLVKMPGARAMRIKTLDALKRLVAGVD